MLLDRITTTSSSMLRLVSGELTWESGSLVVGQLGLLGEGLLGLLGEGLLGLLGEGPLGSLVCSLGELLLELLGELLGEMFSSLKWSIRAARSGSGKLPGKAVLGSSPTCSSSLSSGHVRKRGWLQMVQNFAFAVFL